MRRKEKGGLRLAVKSVLLLADLADACLSPPSRRMSRLSAVLRRALPILLTARSAAKGRPPLVELAVRDDGESSYHG